MQADRYAAFVRAFAEQHRDTPAQLHAALASALATGRAEELERASLLAHRLQGTARMLGLTSVGGLAGALERAIEHARSGRYLLTQEAWQLFLSVADELDGMLGALAAHGDEGPERVAALSALERLVAGVGKNEPR